MRLSISKSCEQQWREAYPVNRTSFRANVLPLIESAVGEGTEVEYLRVIGPSSLNRHPDIAPAVWQGADHQLSLAFVLLRHLGLATSRLHYQELRVIWQEIVMLQSQRHVSVMKRDELYPSEIPSHLVPKTGVDDRIVLYLPAGELARAI